MPTIELPAGQAQLVFILAVFGAMVSFWALAWSVMKPGRMGPFGWVMFWGAMAGLVLCVVVVLQVEVS